MASNGNANFRRINGINRHFNQINASNVNVSDSMVIDSITHASGADADDFTISLTGAFDSSLVISSTGTGTDALQLTASAGGIDIAASGAAADEDIDITASSSVNITSSENVADAITLTASGAAGGIQLTSGTGGVVIDSLLVPNAEATTLTGTDNTLTQAQSGTVFRINPAAAVTVTLPTPVVGMSYEFVFTADTADDVTFNCASVAESMLGNIVIIDDEGTENSRSIAADGSTHDRCLFDFSVGPADLGTHVKFVALSTTLWYVSGVAPTAAGNAAIVVFSSN